MKKPIDRVNEAYSDVLGNAFGEKVRKRINWICSKVKGPNVLDVGCSQGIVSILLAREGKNVLGIDLLPEAIEYAKEELDKEAPPTKELVYFENANFITYPYGERKFDTIIFGEILEHLTDPKEFLIHAKNILSSNGRIIVTVPFGINDYFDHKGTYYLGDVLELADGDLKITEIKFFGKWIGAIFKKNPEEFVTLDSNLMREAEKAFEKIERKGIEQKLDQNRELATLKNLIKEKDVQIKELEELKANSVNQLTTEIDRLKEITENSTLEDRKRLESATNALIEEKKSKVILQQELIDTYKYEEKLIKSYKKLSKKYNALSKSKLGILAVKYWQFKKSLFRGK
ncbi:methyltransferase domain-containing protein [Metabacillus litoralis]|uniref:methyltransferase domain-containing protein n=1 Tax=Metabacillus litoralis TaxID=152268 RepID=UPI00131528C9|nr:methyltransferase domain-containing protein [Metabacillus litoralis]